MTYHIELAATAKADIHGQAEWLRENVSPTAATKWLDGLYKTIDIASPASQVSGSRRERQVPEEIHELLYGRLASGYTSTGSSSQSPGHRPCTLCASHRPRRNRS